MPGSLGSEISFSTGAKCCSEVSVDLVRVAETDKLFVELAPEDVDDFTRMILQAAFGEEGMERWRLNMQV